MIILVDTNLSIKPVAIRATRWLLAAQARYRKRARHTPGHANAPGYARREPSIRDAVCRFNIGKSKIGYYLKALKENGSPTISLYIEGRLYTLYLDKEVALKVYTY